MEDPLLIGRGAAVPLSEIELRTSRSSGPGGQHANVTASRVEAVFDVEASRSLDEEQKRRISARLESALIVPKQRRSTKPSGASRRRRLEGKRRRGEIKRARRRPLEEG